MKRTMMAPGTDLEAIRILVGDDDLEGALDRLGAVLDAERGDLRNEVVLHAARLRDLRTKERRGLLSVDAISSQRAQVRFAVLELIDEVKRTNSAHRPPESAAEMPPLPRAQAVKASHAPPEWTDRQGAYEAALAWLKGRAQAGAVEPSCFLSYAWGEPSHERWVETLAERLVHAGVNVLLDRWHNKPGSSITRFAEMIERADIVCPIGTPRYRRKDRDDQTTYVRAELTLIKTRLVHAAETVVPILLEGTKESSFPPMLQDVVYLDFTAPNAFYPRLFDLIAVINHVPFDDPGLIAHQHAICDLAP